MTISMDKKYRTRSGCAVDILTTKVNCNHPVVAVFTNPDGSQGSVCYNVNGKFYMDDHEHALDLIEVSPYEDFKIDEPVMVSDTTINWYPRHFAGVNSQGLPQAWSNGATSFSAESKKDIVGWYHCRRPTPEELNKTS